MRIHEIMSLVESNLSTRDKIAFYTWLQEMQLFQFEIAERMVNDYTELGIDAGKAWIQVWKLVTVIKPK